MWKASHNDGFRVSYFVSQKLKQIGTHETDVSAQNTPVDNQLIDEEFQEEYDAIKKNKIRRYTESEMTFIGTAMSHSDKSLI